MVRAVDVVLVIDVDDIDDIVVVVRYDPQHYDYPYVI
jgi:hypothetical protein